MSFIVSTLLPPPSPTQILKSTERKFVNIICYKALKLQKRALTISTRAQLIFLEIIIRVKQSAYLRSLHRTTFWSLSMFWNTVTLFTACLREVIKTLNLKTFYELKFISILFNFTDDMKVYSTIKYDRNLKFNLSSELNLHWEKRKFLWGISWRRLGWQSWGLPGRTSSSVCQPAPCSRMCRCVAPCQRRCATPC